MVHHDNLILILVAGFVLAFVFGMAANRLRLSPLVGYLLAGVAVGPFTPGYVADATLAPQIAEIGIILLMFGVGLHFSPADLRSVGRIAVPGALVQIGAATALGWMVGHLIGMGDVEAALFGFALSVASTVVLLRALEERAALKTEPGRIAIGWLLVEDLVMVVALVLLPIFGTAGGADGGTGLASELFLTLLKIGVFIAIMAFAGRRVLPELLIRIAHTRSRELFTLGVLAIALGIAWVAYAVFGASFALGAFVAGMVLNSSPLGHSAGERSLPLRDAFAVLFFVSVGMLFDPSTLIRQPAAIAATVAIVIVGKSLAAFAVARLAGIALRDALVIAVSLAQIGEFSFILVGLALSMGLVTVATSNLVLATALISIALNPLLFKLASRTSGSTHT